MLQTNDTLSPKDALLSLSTHAPFALEGAWRLDSDEARKLTDRAGARPAGGWLAVAALAAGCDVLEASRDQFEPGLSPEEIRGWTSDETTRRLLHAFTRDLVPPTTAAGLFIMLDIHPAWGVHLAHTVHRLDDDEADEPNRNPRNRDLFPSESLQVVGSMVSDALRRIIDRLAHLDPEETYSVQDLSSFVREVCDDIVEKAREDREPQSGLDPLVDSNADTRTNWRSTDFVAQDLLDAYLVPAGVATRTSGTFQIDPDKLTDVEVFTLD